jgi:hypothetical protein
MLLKELGLVSNTGNEDITSFFAGRGVGDTTNDEMNEEDQNNDKAGTFLLSTGLQITKGRVVTATTCMYAL